MDVALLRLAINRISALRPHEKAQLEELVDSETFFRSLSPVTLSRIVGRRIDALDASPDELLARAERDLAFLESRECLALALDDPRYPALLREIYDPPYLLYLRGELPTDAVPSVAVVGTRKPTVAAVIAARRLGCDLAAAGVPVVSGLARGIDAAAHEGALAAGRAGGSSGAILASGIDVVAPASNRGLARALLDHGGFLATEYPPGTPPLKWHFPARNRIISGLCRGTVVVQAPARSGALITADYALDQGRDLFVHEVGTAPPFGAGSAELAEDGAIVVTSASVILDEWGLSPAPVAPPAEPSGESGADVFAATTEAAARARADEIRAALSREVRA